MKYVIWILMLVLLIGQLIFSSGPKLFNRTEVERIEIRNRMNDYPPQLARLSNILENRPESLLLYRLQKNFFSILDLNSLPIVLIPLVFIGFFYLLETKRYADLMIILFLPLVVLTILGPNQLHDAFSLYPFILLSTYYGFSKLVKHT